MSYYALEMIGDGTLPIAITLVLASYIFWMYTRDPLAKILHFIPSKIRKSELGANFVKNGVLVHQEASRKVGVLGCRLSTP